MTKQYIYSVTLGLLACCYGFAQDSERYFPLKAFYTVDVWRNLAEDLKPLQIADDRVGTLMDLMDESTRNRYSKVLKSLNEDPIYLEAQNYASEIYRFLCIPTFSGPFSIKIEIDDESASITTKKIYKRDGLISEINRVLTKGETISLRGFFTVEFWELPTSDILLGGFDGAWWLVECVHDGRYKVIHRFFPNEGIIYTIGKYMELLTGISLYTTYERDHRFKPIGFPD